MMPDSYGKNRVNQMLSDLSYFLEQLKMYREKKYSGINLEFVDFRHTLESMNPPPLILNDRPPCVTKEDREALVKLIRTDVEGDTLNIVPRCGCGYRTGVEWKNTRCPECTDLVTAITEQPIESRVWLRSPTGVAPLINPTFWLILSRAFTTSKFSPLEWLADRNYIGKDVNTAKFVAESQRLIDAGFQRGYNNLYENFPEYMSKLMAMGYTNREVAEKLRTLLEKYGHLVYSEYLPLPNKIVFLTEKTSVHIYADSNIKHALEAAVIISSIDESDPNLTLRVKETRAIKVVTCLAGYARLQFAKTLGGKPGLFRKEILGSRMKWAGRSVIASISGVHNYEELHLPWGYAVGLFKTHLTNKLKRRGWSSVEIDNFLVRHSTKYHPLLDKLFVELIKETELPGIPCILQRNPSLARGSAQCFFITKIKHDVADVTIGMSVLTLVAPNADFDGDSLNNWIVLDKTMYKYISRLAPHTNVFDLNSVRTTSNTAKLQTPTTETIANYIRHGDARFVA